MKLSYTSDPPLQFQEIVALLASGKTPTSDPTLVANQPSQPQQSFQQMGETAIVSKAIADPVAKPASARVRRESAQNRPDVHQWLRPAAGQADLTAASRDQCHIHVCDRAQ